MYNNSMNTQKPKKDFKKKFSNGFAISQLQADVKNLAQAVKFVSFTPKEKEVLYKTVKLNEEVGELCNDILSILRLQRKAKLDKFDKRNIYQEFADVIITTIQLASVAGVDIERAVGDKLKTIEQRYIKEHKK